MTIQDPLAREMAQKLEEALEAFDRLPLPEKIEHLKDAGILGADGKLAPRYAGNWDGDEEEVVTNAAK